jgi:predicted nucleotidyltransferase
MGNRKLVSIIGEALYGQTRQAVLRLFFGQPDRRFLQKDVIERIGLGSGTVQRELERLSKAEILVRTTEGRQNYYQANHRSPVFDELRGLVRKTFGATQVLQEALAPIAKRIDVAFIFGSVASGAEKSDSDLDLMVVANEVSFSDLIPAVREAERELGREVNPSLYTPREFSRKLSERQNFLSTVVEGPKLFLIGDEHELGRLAKKRLAEAPHDQPP